MPGPYRDDRQALHERLRALQNENADLRDRPDGTRRRWLEPVRIALAVAILGAGGVTAWVQTCAPATTHSRPASGFVLDEPSADLPVAPPDMTYAQALEWDRAHPTGRIGRTLTDYEIWSAMTNQSGFVQACGAPDTMQVNVNVAVKYGSAIGVTVDTTPRDERIDGCVAAHIRQRTWPWSSKTEHATIRY